MVFMELLSCKYDFCITMPCQRDIYLFLYACIENISFTFNVFLFCISENQSSWRYEFFHEIKIMKSLNHHSNILTLVGICENDSEYN